jgi:hypothetical protein
MLWGGFAGKILKFARFLSSNSGKLRFRRILYAKTPSKTHVGYPLVI